MSAIAEDHELLAMIERLDNARVVVAAVAALVELADPSDDSRKRNSTNMLVFAVIELLELARSSDNFYARVCSTRDTIEAAADYLAQLRDQRNTASEAAS
jgi:hypothetical protein